MSAIKKPTAVATRAAKAIADEWTHVPPDYYLAPLIDRETHLPELIAVLKEADNQFRLCGWHSRTHPRAMIRAALALFKEPSDA